MINKQGLIFLTLTSLILVLSVYYVTMPSELLLTTNSMYVGNDEVKVNKEEVKIDNTTTIMAMKNIHSDEIKEKVKELNNKLTNKELSFEEKNNVYEEIKVIKNIEAMEEDIELIIKSEYKLDSFVKVNDDIIEITINSMNHDKALVAKIISSVEKKYKNMYVSVSFKD